MQKHLKPLIQAGLKTAFSLPAWMLLAISPALTINAAAGAPTPVLATKDGAFIYRDTGEPFISVGFNLVRLQQLAPHNYNHANFYPDVYDPSEIAATLDRHKSGGFNTVRVFINQRGFENQPSGGVEGPYLDNLADFVRQCAERELVAYLVLPAYLPSIPKYAARDQLPANFDGVMQVFLRDAYQSSHNRFYTDLVGALVQQAGDAMAWTLISVCNEYAIPILPPLTLDSGTAETATGTFDLSEAGIRREIIESNMIAKLDRMIAAVRKAYPQALVGVGSFTYAAVHRSGPEDFDPKPADWMNRYLLDPQMVARADIDYFSWQLNEDAKTVDVLYDSMNPGALWQPSMKRKPMLISEFHVSASADPQTFAERMRRQIEFFAAQGAAGAFYWTYDDEVLEKYQPAVSADGDDKVFRIFSELLDEW